MRHPIAAVLAISRMAGQLWTHDGIVTGKLILWTPDLLPNSIFSAWFPLKSILNFQERHSYRLIPIRRFNFSESMNDKDHFYKINKLVKNLLLLWYVIFILFTSTIHKYHYRLRMNSSSEFLLTVWKIIINHWINLQSIFLSIQYYKITIILRL